MRLANSGITIKLKTMSKKTETSIMIDGVKVVKKSNYVEFRVPTYFSGSELDAWKSRNEKLIETFRNDG